ncbi:Similar to Probable octanoyltransferase; acc. no. O36017 [Pyronema omphalodes CBS 100304]|uniref:Octanoyltransferase n=1 Tax=Pyronema omphalodes (strain CBS 100304) TaxID=1076935 RepID=U4KX21_PYROM|nr:Similar to Probable octanoyltransferase; acc. no. O36017 [Pyronema omphalodes CBS 100304]
MSCSPASSTTRHILHHLHLGRIPFTKTGALQSLLVSKHLRAKASATTSPPPTLLTSEFNPVYTLGRRETSVTDEQLSHLRYDGKAEVHSTLRGGQTTFHGPGQMTGYLICDLKSHNLTPRCYIRKLESSIISLLEKYGVKAFTTEDPGVWVTTEEKICAVGVHMRRNVTSYGVGLNVNTDLRWLDRIVGCGLVGKRATSLQRLGVEGKTVEEVAGDWATELVRTIGMAGTKRVGVEELLGDEEKGAWERGEVLGKEE